SITCIGSTTVVRPRSAGGAQRARLAQRSASAIDYAHTSLRRRLISGALGWRLVMAPQRAIPAAPCPRTGTPPVSVPRTAGPARRSPSCACPCVPLSCGLLFSGPLSCASPSCDRLSFCGRLISGQWSSGGLFCASLSCDVLFYAPPPCGPRFCGLLIFAL